MTQRPALSAGIVQDEAAAAGQVAVGHVAVGVVAVVLVQVGLVGRNIRLPQVGVAACRS